MSVGLNNMMTLFKGMQRDRYKSSQLSKRFIMISNNEFFFSDFAFLTS